MLTRLRVKHYKSLVDVEVHLKPLSVLFGPNSAGKSNFLDALQLLSRIATSRTLQEAFNPPYRGTPLESFTFDSRGVRGLLERDRACFSLEADVELSPWVVSSVNQQISRFESGSSSGNLVQEARLRYRIEIEVLPKSGILRVIDESVEALDARGAPTRRRKPFLYRHGDQFLLRIEGRSGPVPHRPAPLDHSVLSEPHIPSFHPHLVAMRQELASWFFFYLEPRERMRTPTPVREVHHIGLMGEELASFLNTLRAIDEPQFRAIEKSMRLIIPSATAIELELDERGEVELRLIEDGIPVPARVLSEGTLRILGLLALGGAKEPPALLGFEEPENGVHPRRVRLIAELLKTRASTGNTQLIVTTHSPLLVDQMAEDTLFVFRKRQGSTDVRAFETWGSIGRNQEIDSALDDEEGPLPVSQLILRGDLDD